MKPVRAVDPSHILAVCTYTATVTGAQPPEITLTTTGEAITIRIAPEHDRIAAIVRALHQAGYDTTADCTLITVRGWSPARLKIRIARLDVALQWLTEQLPFAPRTAVALYRKAIQVQGLSSRDARNHARHELVRNLRDLIQLHAGPLTRYDPPELPGPPEDPRTGMLLRQCRWLEDEADLLLSRHRSIATQAIAEHRLETEHPAEADRTTQARVAAYVAAEPAAGVAAHDTPTETCDSPIPSTNSTTPERDARPEATPARRGA